MGVMRKLANPRFKLSQIPSPGILIGITIMIMMFISESSQIILYHDFIADIMTVPVLYSMETAKSYSFVDPSNAKGTASKTLQIISDSNALFFVFEKANKVNGRISVSSSLYQIKFKYEDIGLISDDSGEIKKINPSIPNYFQA